MTKKKHSENATVAKVGVGLRSLHYNEALKGTEHIDFVEVHAENFFASGGLTHEYIEQLKHCYQISLHSVSMGLGSAVGIDREYINKLKRLANRINPVLISDHVSYSWGIINGSKVHAGDLLPVERTKTGLNTLSDNIDKVQNILGIKILVENISCYLSNLTNHISEPEFLTELSANTGCGLLVDLNNLLVNAFNFETEDPLCVAENWIKQVPPSIIDEYHLAGSTEVSQGNMLIDDHAKPVSQTCWQLFKTALAHTGPKPTVIEWDNDLPSWQELIKESCKAKQLIIETNFDPGYSS